MGTFTSLNVKPPPCLLRRQAEHRAVAFALSHLLGHAEWRLSHNDEGKPQLHVRDESPASGKPSERVPISRWGEVWAAVARWDQADIRGGVDFVLIDDLRVQRCAGDAPRVMSTHEQILWRGCEAWAWATKEAMFKGHGPDLEFRSQALLKEAMNARQGWHPAWRGSRKALVWRVVQGSGAVALGLGRMTPCLLEGLLTDGVVQIVDGQFVFERPVWSCSNCAHPRICHGQKRRTRAGWIRSRTPS